MQGWIVIENFSSPEFNERLRQAVIDASGEVVAGQATGCNILLTKDRI